MTRHLTRNIGEGVGGIGHRQQHGLGRGQPLQSGETAELRMDTRERERLDRINRAAEREKTPDDPKPAEARDGKPLMIMVAAALAAAVIVLGIMWMNNTRYDGTSPRPVAEGLLALTPPPIPQGAGGFSALFPVSLGPADQTPSPIV